MVPLNVDCSVPSVYRTFIKEAPYVSELDEKMSVTESKVVYGLHRVEIHRGSRRLELQYQHEYNSISTSIGLTENPMVNFSGVVGTPLLVLGTDLSYDTASGSLFSFVDVCVFFNASYCHIESPLTYTDVGAKLAHSFSTNENTLTIGTQKALDQLTSVKARINNHGMIIGAVGSTVY
ncbi:mitochondrial outer membrane protein porin of 34 kDa-like [Papaver somniferum]|uniref:mitochondrial outer membrane protein porin of 34 kDa-like n=1 Tax=Papaver somniferum TaxID=3469 RepID=UPI000E6FA0A8|nr:mitochondrial outer membrane protein porin of 34 kDa-like [Papaver somniferum]